MYQTEHNGLYAAANGSITVDQLCNSADGTLLAYTGTVTTDSAGNLYASY